MTFGAVASVVGIATGINSLTGGGVSKLFGGEGQQSGGSATATANPMAPYQAQLAQMYQGYLQPGASSNIQAMPGFSQYKTGVLDPAMQASQAKAASTGQLYSGAESVQLEQIGQQGYSEFMQNYLSNLYTGATGNAAAGQSAGNTVSTANQQGFQQGLGALATGMQSFAGQTNSMGNQVYNPVINNANSQYGMGAGSLLSGTGGIAD